MSNNEHTKRASARYDLLAPHDASLRDSLTIGFA